MGSHGLLSSSSSGLLYLNDDFQGGDLFFTEPNALTVRVRGAGAVVWNREHSCGLRIQNRRIPEANAGKWLGPPEPFLSWPPSSFHHLSVQELS